MDIIIYESGKRFTMDEYFNTLNSIREVLPPNLNVVNKIITKDFGDPTKVKLWQASIEDYNTEIVLLPDYLLNNRPNLQSGPALVVESKGLLNLFSVVSDSEVLFIRAGDELVSLEDIDRNTKSNYDISGFILKDFRIFWRSIYYKGTITPSMIRLCAETFPVLKARSINVKSNHQYLPIDHHLLLKFYEYLKENLYYKFSYCDQSSKIRSICYDNHCLCGGNQ